jgi:hypothetical protein
LVLPVTGVEMENEYMDSEYDEAIPESIEEVIEQLINGVQDQVSGLADLLRVTLSLYSRTLQFAIRQRRVLPALLPVCQRLSLMRLWMLLLLYSQ